MVMIGFSPSFLRFLAAVELPLALLALTLSLELAAAGCRVSGATGSGACEFIVNRDMCSAECEISFETAGVGGRLGR